MPKIDLKKQAQAIDRLKAELAQLDRKADELKKSMNITSDSELNIDPAAMPPELADALSQVKKAAEDAGRSAAAALAAETADSTAAGTVKTAARRRGIAV